jgi:hypothetical protein
MFDAILTFLPEVGPNDDGITLVSVLHSLNMLIKNLIYLMKMI